MPRKTQTAKSIEHSTEAKKDAEASRLSRRRQIAIAVVEILAHEGAKRLTHRRVDQKLGLAEGSTSAYYRRREDLLGCGHGYLLEISHGTFDEILQPLVDAIDRGDDVPLEKISQQLSAVWAAFADSVNMKARLEFLLEATRSPELRKLEREHDRVQHRVFASLFRYLGAADPLAAAIEFSNWMRAEAWTDYLAPSGHERKPHSAAVMQRKILQIAREDLSN